MRGQAVTRSRHTVVVRRWNRIAKGVLWIAAGLTLTMLTLIIGYILINGFYTRSIEQEPVASISEESIGIGGAYPDIEFSVLVPRALRLRDIAYDDLRAMYAGENRYWGFLTGQNQAAMPAVWSGERRFPDALAEYLVLDDAGLPDTIARLNSVEQVERWFSEETGAVVLVPAEMADSFADAKIAPVRQISVAINSSVTELVAGRRVRSVDEAQLPALLRGDIRSWNELSGSSDTPEGTSDDSGRPDAPISVVRLSEDASPVARSAQEAFVQDSSPQGSRTAASVEAAARFLAETPGAVALLPRPETVRRDIPVLDVRFVRHSANLRPSFLWRPPSRAGEVGGISTIILNTLAVIAFVVLIATPIGVAAAIYIVEYAKQGRFLMVLRIGTDTLAGVPSIIFGLFGLVFFSQALGLQTGLLAGALTLTLMILPTIVRTAEEALRSVPQSHREGSLALGATKMQTIFRVVLPSALPGILTGVILGIGRAVGETAAVLFTMGSNLALLSSLNSPLRVLSVHLYLLVRETISIPNAFATATILVLIVLIINTTARRLINRINSGVTPS